MGQYRKDSTTGAETQEIQILKASFSWTGLE
jgi:hypothetical protein